MSTSIEQIRAEQLAGYADVPMVCDVRSMFFAEEDDGGLHLQERPIPVPYTKDYDSYAEGGPLQWSKRFDLSQWGLWVACERGLTLGGAAIAWNSSNLALLDGRSDVAVLWDIRVRPTNRRQGIGAALFRHATQWAKSLGCTLLKIETQNVNVPACRFYAKMGCQLDRVDRTAYRDHPQLADEVMLVWHLDISNGTK